MADLTKEDYEALPEAAKEDYTQVGDVYKHAGVLKLKSSLNDLDEKYKSAEKLAQELQDKFTQQEQLEADKIAQAREEALKNADTKGETDKIHELYAQKMADLEKRSKEAGRQEAEKEFTVKQLDTKVESIKSNIAAEWARDKESQRALELVLGTMVKRGDGKIEFFDDQGRALSVEDQKAFVEDVVKQSPMFKHLIKGETPTNSPGFANGAGVNNGRTVVTNAKAEEAKKKGDGIGHLNARFQEAFKR